MSGRREWTWSRDGSSIYFAFQLRCSGARPKPDGALTISKADGGKPKRIRGIETTYGTLDNGLEKVACFQFRSIVSNALSIKSSAELNRSSTK